MESPSFVFTHVHVYASDPEATVAWLTDGLGGEVVSRHQHAGYPEAIQVHLGGLLIQVRGHRENERFDDVAGRPFGLDHFGLSVADFDATMVALRARGIEAETDFGNGFSVPPGVAFLRGPDGLWVEITSLEYEPAPDTVLAGGTASPAD